jgi:hypothetical protein
MSVPEQCGDVVFLAEMCERNGPVVVLSSPPGIHIPSDLPVRLFSCDVFGLQGNVDGNESLLQRDAFCILRLSPQLPKQQQPSSPLLSAQTSATPQSEQPPPQNNPYVAAHHFQMCEMSGRGLVRKVCVAFLTNDHHKLFQNLKIINQELVSVARCVCQGNIATFTADVECILAALRLLNEPPALERHADDLDYRSVKDALPGLLQQYERLNSQPVYKLDPTASPVPEARGDVVATSVAPMSPFDRLRLLQRFGRPIETFRPLLSTFTPERERLVNEALSNAQSVCSLAPDVLWMVEQEARFMSAGDTAGESFHTSVCSSPVCSLSVFLKTLAAKDSLPECAPTCCERPELRFKVDDSVSALLRHHVLTEKVKEDELQQVQAMLRGHASSKLQPAKVELPGLKEVRQLLTESVFKNIVFALLKGENVIIRGKPDDKVIIISMIRALSIFIPQNVLYCGTKSDQPPPRLYAEWREAPLDICDLGSVKLAGGPLSLEVHERGRSYVSKINIGDKYITAMIPRYGC